jgi:thioredoxin 1
MIGGIAIGALAGLMLGMMAGGRCSSGACPTGRRKTAAAIIGMTLGGFVGGVWGWTQNPHDDDSIPRVQSAAEFDAVVAREPVVLVDFYATWCPPCRTLAPRLAELSRQYAGKATFVKVDVDKSPELSQRMGVRSMPTVFVFAGGKAVDSRVGLRPAEDYRTMLDKALAGQRVPDSRP